MFDVAVDIRARLADLRPLGRRRPLRRELPAALHSPGLRPRLLRRSRSAVDVEYKCTDFYDPGDEITVAWNDPAIGIAWPVRDPILSAKDRGAPRLAELLDRLPVYEPAARGEDPSRGSRRAARPRPPRRAPTRHEVVALPHAELDITDAAAVREALASPRARPRDQRRRLQRWWTGPRPTRRPRSASTPTGRGILAEAAAAAGLPIVHVSTDYVFDGERGAPYTEDDRAAPPLAGTGRSKLTGEELVRDANPRHFIVRTAWLFHTEGRTSRGGCWSSPPGVPSAW